MHLLRDACGKEDPFRQIKDMQNQRMLGILPFLRKLVKKAHDPLHTAVKLAIIGNTIDIMMGNRPTDIVNSITERLKDPISERQYLQFRKRLDQCASLVYLGDNAGEIVCDRLLLETIKELRNPDIVFVVRSVPTLNDATLREARAAGIHKAATVLENGIDGPCPGTILGRCSQEVQERISEADMVISKGGGNFDALEEERGRVRDRITFMLLSKCVPYCHYFGVELHRPILAQLGPADSQDP